jgi:hypothetical protein
MMAILLRKVAGQAVHWASLGMRSGAWHRRLLCLAATVLLFVSGMSAQDARQQIKKQLGKLQHEADSAPRSDVAWKQLGPSALLALNRAHSSLAAGRLYAALDDMSVAWKQLAGYGAIAENPAVQQQGMQAFEAAWRRLNGTLTDDERRYDAGSWDKSPAVVRALAETAEASVQPMYTASRSYAGITEPVFGLVYLGYAQGWAESALFYKSLRFEVSGQPRPMHSFLPEIQRLADQVQSAYKPPVSIAHRAEFDHISAVLKQARELDAAHLNYGALLEYLEALRHFRAIERPPDLVLSEEDVHASAVVARGRLSQLPFDDSIGQLFLEKAEAEIADSAGKQGGLNAAKLDLDVTLPAYFAAVQSTGTPMTAPTFQVTVTLVRWPYT